MGKRLYVGNLPYDVDEASLREVFSQEGRQVERVHIPLDRETQRPRGFAFVEFRSEADAQQAMQSLNGKLLGTRQMRVTEAEDSRRPGPGGGGPGGPRGDRGPAPGPGSSRPPDGGPRGAAPGGGGDERARENRFGPDARPKREREAEFKRSKPQRRRLGGDDEGGGGGRRGGGRDFDDDDDD